MIPNMIPNILAIVNLSLKHSTPTTATHIIDRTFRVGYMIEIFLLDKIMEYANNTTK